MAYQHLLVPCDGSELSFNALKRAGELAQALGAKLTVMSIVIADAKDPESLSQIAPMLKNYAIGAYEKAEDVLAHAKTLCANEYGVNINTQIVVGEVKAQTIVTVAEESQVDLVVMGSHGYQGFKKLVLGSLAQDVLSSTELAVLVVKQA